MMKAIVVAVVAVVFFVVSQGFPVPNPGIVNPKDHYQRYRRSEYPAHNAFFQWWYFWVRDVSSDRHWAFAFSMSDGGKNANVTNQGAFGVFAHVDKATGFQGTKYIRFPIEALSVTNKYDFSVGSIGDQSTSWLKMTEIDSDNLVISGHYAGADHLWWSNGMDPNSVITFNLTVSRIHGWYGQKQFETPDHFDPVIMWNTYTHDSLVQGTITIDGVSATLTHSPQFRAYGDMNWGGQFPEPPSPTSGDMSYHWGWYAVAVPSVNPAEDISIIIGEGKTWGGVLMGAMQALFGDVQLGENCAATVCGNQAENVFIHDEISHPVELTTTSDGKLYNFTSWQANWVNFTDSYGTALLPLTQYVILETTHQKLTMEFNSNPGEYVRLLFPLHDSVFSDFEALGVAVNVTVYGRTSESAPWTQQLAFFSNDGGLEFGYRVETPQAWRPQN